MTIGAVLTGLLVLGAGCRTMTGQSVGTNIDNKTTTAAVKARLAADQLRNLSWVDVDTNAGTVYLSGTAATPEDKARATELAAQVDGVRRVVNNIEVRTPDASASASPSAAEGTRQTLTAEVASVDPATGRALLRTSDGQLLMQVPSSVLGEDVRAGDRVTVDIGVRKTP
jgi:hypothetical protein